MAAIRSVHRPPLPYQSLSTSTSWAVNSFDRDFPGDPNGRLIHTGQQLTGARFPNGRVEAMEASQFANLMTARAMVNRETVNEYHVNLESAAGRLVKDQMNLPFQEHSRVDPIKAAEQADEMYSHRREGTGSILREGLIEVGAEAVAALGGIGVGMLLYNRKRAAASQAVDGLKSLDLGRLLGGGVKQGMDLSQEIINGVRVYRGFDPNSAFKGQAITRLAEAEIWAHGSPKGPSQDWHLLGATKTAQPTADVVRQVIQQEKVQSVLIDSCNAARSVISTPKGATVTYGLGYGVASSQEREGIGAVRSWLDAVVVSEGDTAQVFSKSAIQAELERRGLDTRTLPTNKLRTVKGDFLEGDTSTLGVFKTAAGETRLTAHPIGKTAEDVMKVSMPLGEAPSITLRHEKGGPSFEVGGKSFSSFEEAISSLTQGIRARTRAAGQASRLLEAAGLESSEATVLKSFESAGNVAANVSKETRAAFHGPVLMGILAAGVLAVGGLMLHHHDHPATDGSTSNHHPSHEPRHRKHEQNETATQTERRPGGNPRSNTKIRLTDADLNMDQVDRMFANHFKRGYAYS